MTTATLYSFRRCPYAIRARMAIAYAGVDVELREVVLKDKPQAMLDVSPKGTVPVLQLPSGEVIDESRDIMHWAMAQVPQASPAGRTALSEQTALSGETALSKTIALSGETALSKQTALSQKAPLSEHTTMSDLIDTIDHTFKDQLDHYKYADRFPEQSAEAYRDVALALLAPLVKRLEQSPFIFGEDFSFADIAIFPFIRQFAHVDKPWFDRQAPSALQRWLELWLNHPLFLQCMSKYPQWKTESDSVYFPDAQTR